MNEILPVPGTTFTECYPSQFMTSYLLQEGGITQPAFKYLECPQSWYAVGPYTANYIACCPNGYKLTNPEVVVFKDRPAFGATCYTPLPLGTPVLVTKYDRSSLLATVTFDPPDESAQAYAHPIEGTAFGVKVVESLPPGTSATTTPAASTTGAAATYTVLANTAPVFTPNTLDAKIGDTILFQFMSGNHSATQSTFEAPCDPLANGADSGYMSNVNNSINPPPAFAFRISSTSPSWFYSKQAGECGSGMTFALNPTTEKSQAKFQAAAIETAQRNVKKHSGLSSGAKAGIAIAVIVPIIILAVLAFLFIRRRKRTAPADSIPAEYYANENKSQDIHDGAFMDVKDDRPVVPPKTSEMPGNEQASELPGYTTHEMMGSPGTHYDEGPSPLTPPTSKYQVPKRKPVYTHFNDNDD